MVEPDEHQESQHNNEDLEEENSELDINNPDGKRKTVYK